MSEKYANLYSRKWRIPVLTAYVLDSQPQPGANRIKFNEDSRLNDTDRSKEEHYKKYKEQKENNENYSRGHSATASISLVLLYTKYYNI